jgi:hypothetical protein
MSGDLISQFLGSPPDPPPRQRRATASDDASGISESYVSMLDLVLVAGQRIALPYSTLLKVEFDPTKGIALHFSTDEVTISGYRLEALYRAIVQHRAREIKESGSKGEFEKEGSGPVITEIRCQPAS